MNLVIENPKASITALIGIIIGVLQIFVPMDFLTPQMQTNINLVLYPVIVFLLGHWSRINKEQAKALETPRVKEIVAEVKKSDEKELEERNHHS